MRFSPPVTVAGNTYLEAARSLLNDHDKKKRKKQIDATFSHGVARITSLQNQTHTRGCCVSINKQFASFLWGLESYSLPPLNKQHLCVQPGGAEIQHHIVRGWGGRGQKYIYFIQERAQVALFQIPLVEADKKMNRMGNKQLGGMQWNHFTVVCVTQVRRI